MDSGFYAACTALIARSQALDLLANNLANGSTTGYRAQHNIFRSVLASASGRPMSGLNQAVNDYGLLGGSRLDLAQGSIQRTGNDLDAAIEGSGFFVVQTADGRFFTRNGNFQVSAKGQLVTSQGDAVMGDQGPIQVVGAPVSISPDGVISVNGAVAGKLKVVEFPPSAQLESVGKSYYSAPARSEMPATHSQVRQGALESSNVDSVSSVVQLITIQRSAEMMQRALTMFNSDINRVATEELPRSAS